jgi:maleylacetate reductase
LCRLIWRRFDDRPGKAIATRTGADQIVIPTTYAGSEMTDILGETSGGEKTTRRDPSILPERLSTTSI